MIETFACLLMAHALADFVLQTQGMVATKRRPLTLLLHGAIVLATAQAALGTVAAWELLALAAVHTAIDIAKTFSGRTGLWPFLIDQGAHAASLIALAAYAPDLFARGWLGGLDWWPAAAALLAGLILATRAGGFAVGFLMSPFEGITLPEGLPRGGWLIGVLERGLIFLLVLVGHPAGIGFLIAAKSVLRFETTSRDQRAGEYVIVGTLASFGWALVVSYGTVALLSALPPLGFPPAAP